MIYTVRNWADFQHYKDRNPPWIKLHKGLLDNREFHCLPVASRALAPMIWLLASEDVKGRVDCSPENLAFRLRCNTDDVNAGLNPLIEAKFLIPCLHGASGVIAQRLRDAEPETETETEKNFSRFWDLWPKGPRKQARGKCFSLWKKQSLCKRVDEILVHVSQMKNTDGWKTGYVPAPEVYLRNERWDGAEPVAEPERKRVAL